MCTFVIAMKKIDRETTRRILDAADIVEVVSDFVTLKRRGANYIGLCPFHNERTPSFSVSKSRGICKCFSCGKGGSPVNFLMELESMSFQEALRWLAKKYGIEIKEREETDEERAAEMERESMLAVNDFAMKYFEEVMTDTDDGRDIGMAYFRERGINEQSCRKFHLGYSPERSDSLYRKAIAKGYSEKFLLSTGLCARSDRGVYDRFRGRVIYPVFSLSGRVVAFGGRTLRKDKSVAKYVNSPESIIYSKSRELYGLYQARQAIARKDKCILVEGYMDVISMHQAGIENVVASSGTSLTDGQIRLIHRFTRNVTVIYDSDAAGIKASLRGIDMLLAQGMNVKVLSLPDGDDPDSFAQSHTDTEVEKYLEENETDFIRFKTDILLGDAGADPIRRANAINDIVVSISVIPDPITRSVYIDECSRRFNIKEEVLSLRVDKLVNDLEENARQSRQRCAGNEDIDRLEARESTVSASEKSGENAALSASLSGSDVVEHVQAGMSSEDKAVVYLRPFEREVLRYALRYGVMTLCDAYLDDNSTVPLSIIDYIEGELQDDGITFSDSVHAEVWKKVIDLSRNYGDSLREFEKSLDELNKQLAAEGIEKIRNEAADVADIQRREKMLEAEVEAELNSRRHEYNRRYMEHILCSDPDNAVRHLVTDLVSDRYTLSKVYSKYAHVETEEERLTDLVPRAVHELKNAILINRIADVKQKIRVATLEGDNAQLESLMNDLMDLNRMKSDFARYLGERIITPGRR